MNAPNNLKHKPIIAVNDYQSKHENIGGSDAEALSIGFSQWDSTEISAKVFRYINQWSPQSEELPLHRVIDLCILTISSFIHRNSTKSFTSLQEEVVDQNGIKKIKEHYENNKSTIDPKIQELKKVIDEFCEHILYESKKQTNG